MTATTTTPLSAAKRQALAVLVEGERSHRPVRESNHTTPTDKFGVVDLGDRRRGRLTRLAIYWQTRVWLSRHGYITTSRLGSVGMVCTLTDAGRALAAEADIR